MKLLFKVLLAFVMVFGFTVSGVNVSWAAASSDSVLEPRYDDLPSTFEVGKKYKLTVITDKVGELEDEGKFKFIISNGETIESVKTSLNRSKKYYTTTGYFTPKSEGTYILLFGIKQKNAKGEILEGLITEELKVVDKNKINLTVTPNIVTVKVGEEVPILVTYNSSISTKISYSKKVQEFASSRKSGVYKKVVLYKAEKAGEVTLEVKASQSRTGRVETKVITIVVE